MTHLTIGGRTRFLVDWALDAAIDPKIVRARIAAGWDAERAISAPQAFFPKRRAGFHRKKRRLSGPPVVATPRAAQAFRPGVGGFHSYPIEALDVLRRLA